MPTPKNRQNSGISAHEKELAEILLNGALMACRSARPELMRVKVGAAMHALGMTVEEY